MKNPTNYISWDNRILPIKISICENMSNVYCKQKHEDHSTKNNIFCLHAYAHGKNIIAGDKYSTQL